MAISYSEGHILVNHTPVGCSGGETKKSKDSFSIGDGWVEREGRREIGK